MGIKNSYGDPQNQSNGCCLRLSLQYNTEGEEFLNRIVTGDKTWVVYVNVETKQQSMLWSHIGFPNRLRKACQTLSVRKIMVIMIGDANRILIVEFMECKTVSSGVYCNNLRKLKRATQNKCHTLLTSGFVFLYDSSPHMARQMQDLLHLFKWHIFNCPSYSLDIVFLITMRSVQ